MKWLLFCCFLPILISAADFTVDGVDFSYRIPANYHNKSAIMILFGGRNWQGEKTLSTYHFERLADKHQLFLLAPSFNDQQYWQPEEWSGKCLLKAVRTLEEKYGLESPKLYLYGYSAGGQCSALFYAWMPARVAAWGLHASGVYPDKVKFSAAPALITCGFDDSERFLISRHFIYRYREAGGNLLWKPLQGGHELSAAALELATTWFDAILAQENSGICGEDDTMQIGDRIDVEFRNPLLNEKIRELWQK